jgi:hypothetical protein
MDRIFHYLYTLDYYFFTTDTVSVYRIYDVNRNDYKLIIIADVRNRSSATLLNVMKSIS